MPGLSHVRGEGLSCPEHFPVRVPFTSSISCARPACRPCSCSTCAGRPGPILPFLHSFALPIRLICKTACGGDDLLHGGPGTPPAGMTLVNTRSPPPCFQSAEEQVVLVRSLLTVNRAYLVLYFCGRRLPARVGIPEFLIGTKCYFVSRHLVIAAVLFPVVRLPDKKPQRQALG